jgi:hypothetical protein
MSRTQAPGVKANVHAHPKLLRFLRPALGHENDDEASDQGAERHDGQLSDGFFGARTRKL